MDKETEIKLKMLNEKIEELLKEEPFQLFGEDGLGWFPPRCPVCNNLISQKFASSRLVCLVCNKEFELKEVRR